MIRVNDTRIYHEFDEKYMLREFTSREAKVNDLRVSLEQLNSFIMNSVRRFALKNIKIFRTSKGEVKMIEFLFLCFQFSSLKEFSFRTNHWSRLSSRAATNSRLIATFSP